MNTKEIKELAINNYKEFCQLEGSEYIASEFALETILKLIDRFNIENVLEIGLGIGCITDTILKYSKLAKHTINYYGTEKNEFCLSSLPLNVSDYKNIRLYNELNEIKNQKFDLIILDGSDDFLENIKEYANKSAILFVEGDRKKQTESLREIFPNHYFASIITLKKNPNYAHEGRGVNNYIGGGQLIFVNPTTKMKLYYLKEKVKTFIKYRIRKLKHKL